MSYHILHQFDEQWFADSGQDQESGSDDFLRSSGRPDHGVPNSRAKVSQRPWVITILSLIVAACSLYFAMDASRQTIELRQRISELESRFKK